MIDVDEIHVVNNKGILTYSSVTEFIGYDFIESEQTKPFLSIDSNGLAQDPQSEERIKNCLCILGSPDLPSMIPL